MGPPHMVKPKAGWPARNIHTAGVRRYGIVAQKTLPEGDETIGKKWRERVRGHPCWRHGHDHDDEWVDLLAVTWVPCILRHFLERKKKALLNFWVVNTHPLQVSDHFNENCSCYLYYKNDSNFSENNMYMCVCIYIYIYTHTHTHTTNY